MAFFAGAIGDEGWFSHPSRVPRYMNDLGDGIRWRLFSV